MAWLEVWRAEEAPFTSQERAVVAEIAHHAAVALTCAGQLRPCAKLAEAWRTERAVLLQTIAAEIAHEMRYPINFFRSVFLRSAAGTQLDAEEVEIGCEEVERLERLVSGLRRLPTPAVERASVGVKELVLRAKTLLGDRLGNGKPRLCVDDTSRIWCDADQATQVLVNLLSNALDAAADVCAGEVGITWNTAGAAGGTLAVWDTGPGFQGSSSNLFVPWSTTKPNGTGLGLTIAHRIVKAHGWSITAERRENATCFVIGIPASDVICEPESRGETDCESAGCR